MIEAELWLCLEFADKQVDLFRHIELPALPHEGMHIDGYRVRYVNWYSELNCLEVWLDDTNGLARSEDPIKMIEWLESIGWSKSSSVCDAKTTTTAHDCP